MTQAQAQATKLGPAGLREWYSACELVGLPGMPATKSGVIRRATRESWKYRNRAGRGGGREYHITSLPAATRAHLALSQQPAAPVAPLPGAPAPEPRPTTFDKSAAWRRYESVPQTMKDEAQRRVEILSAVEQLVAVGLRQDSAIAQVVEHRGVNRATIYRWLAAVRSVDRQDWLAALVPAYSSHAPTAQCDPEAWETFKADYLRLEAPAATACYERLKRIAVERGWVIPTCSRTLSRRIHRELPAELIVLSREGQRALDRLFPAQERDHSVFRAVGAVNADGHRFDVFVRWPDGVIRRPQMVAWQDIYSGKVLSYRVDHTENLHSVRLSFGDLVEGYGIPDHAYLDNGRAFAAKWLTGGVPNRYRFKVKEEEPAGLLTTMGVTVHWCTPYHGQAKPIERAFRDLCEYVAKHPKFSGAYTGNRPDAKPENYASKAVELSDFLAVLEQEVRAHNARRGRRSDVCRGESFDAVFWASYAQGPVKKASDEQRRLWLLAAEQVKTARDDGAIRLLDNRYWCEALAQHRGETVTVRFDPDYLHSSIHVYASSGSYIGQAECVAAVGFADSQAAAEHARAKRSRRKAARSLLEAEVRMSASDVASQLPDVPEPATPTAEVVHLTRPAAPPAPASPPPCPAFDEDVLEEATAAIASLEDARRQREDLDKEDDLLWDRYWRDQQLLESGGELTAEEQAWMTSYESTADFRGRLKFEQHFKLREA